LSQRAGFSNIYPLKSQMKKRWAAKLDDQGRIILPDDAARRFGFQPGDTFLIEEKDHELRIHRPLTSLRRITIEPTNQCNLTCLTCMRNVWNEPAGRMSTSTFSKIISDIQEFNPTPMIFFGGYGEPLSHPEILTMLQQAKSTGASVEMITNATLLDEKTILALCQIGINRLWVSIDGATPASYADIRLGDALPGVIASLEFLANHKANLGLTEPRLGIAFVAMQRNIADLPAVIELGLRLGADQFSVSNVLAHTPELMQEVLLNDALDLGSQRTTENLPRISLPRLDITQETKETLLKLMGGPYRLALEHQFLNPSVRVCPFIEDGSLSIRWDSTVSPCPPLLHSHMHYLENHPRLSHAFSVGNLMQQSLKDIWLSPRYLELRSILQDFDFSPCATCNACEMSEQNLEDCLGNLHPTCGGCLWAQGLIQCP
jgi:MoaA/NifB/PqqE/SkfB family radical SAM enzyme